MQGRKQSAASSDGHDGRSTKRLKAAATLSSALLVVTCLCSLLWRSLLPGQKFGGDGSRAAVRSSFNSLWHTHELQRPDLLLLLLLLLRSVGRCSC